MAEHEVAIPDVAGHVTISLAGWLRGARILVDGAPAKKSGWGKVILPRADGSTVEAKLSDHLVRTVPSIQIGRDKYQAGVAVPTVQVILAVLPFGLIAVGGALGGLCGGLAFGVNQGIIRSPIAPIAKAVLMIGVLAVASVVCITLASLFWSAVR